MKIGYILKKFPRLSETFILNELLALEAKGIEVEVFSLRDADEEPRHAALDRLRAPVTCIQPVASKNIFRHLESRWGNLDGAERALLPRLLGRLDPSDPLCPEALAAAVALAGPIRERGITHLHAHFGTIATATAAELSLLTSVPFSFTMHAKDLYRETVLFPRLAGWLRASVFAVTVCEVNARHIRERVEPAAARKIRVLYNGLDLTEWTPPSARAREPLFVGVGRFVEKKGFCDFLEACARLRSEGYSFRAALVGSGELEAQLREQHSRLELQSIVEMPGALPQDAVRELVGRASLLVAPCRVGADGNRDALPTVLLEAMALSTPCLSTPVGGIEEIIRDGEGWIVPPASPRVLAKTMAHVLNNPEEGRTRGLAARRRVERMFDISHNIAQLASWFGDSPSVDAASPGPLAGVGT